MFEARLGPILVKKVLNLFAISFVSVMVTAASLNKLGNALFDLFLDKISFIVFHVFFISFLKFVKQDSKYVFLADRMLRLKLSAQPYGQPNAKYVRFCTCTRYLMCT